MATSFLGFNTALQAKFSLLSMHITQMHNDLANTDHTNNTMEQALLHMDYRHTKLAFALPPETFKTFRTVRLFNPSTGQTHWPVP